MAAGFEGHREGERKSACGCARRRRRGPLRDGMRAAPPSAARGHGRTEGARRAQEGHDAGGRCPPVRSDGAHAAVPGGALPGRGGRGPAGPRRAFGALSGGHGQKRLARRAQARAFDIEARIGHARPGSREGGGEDPPAPAQGQNAHREMAESSPPPDRHSWDHCGPSRSLPRGQKSKGQTASSSRRRTNRGACMPPGARGPSRGCPSDGRRRLRAVARSAQRL